MTRIITTAYSYKPPPRRKKAVPLAGPAVIATKRSRRPVWGEPAAELETRAASRGKANEAALGVVHPAANDDRKPPHAAASSEKPVIVTTARRKQMRLRGEPVVPVSTLPAQEDRSAAGPSAIVTTAGRKRRITDCPTLPMELPLSRRPIERDGDAYKRLKTAMTRQLRGETS